MAHLIQVAGIPPPDPSAGIAGARRYSDEVGKLVSRSSVALAEEPMLTFEGPHGTIAAKLYKACHGPPAGPLLVYLHGGGFRQGAISGWDAALRMLVRCSAVSVLSIDYRLAPEHPFPTAFDEVSHVLRRLIAEPAVHGMTISGLALGGDSAGANLALASALSLRDEGLQVLKYLLLFYGVYSTDTSSASWTRVGGMYGLSVRQMQEIWAEYLADRKPDWRVEPGKAELQGLPAARLIVGDLDPLLDENIMMHRRLLSAGVSSTLTILPNVNHGVIRYAGIAPVVGDVLRDEGQALRNAFS